MRRCYNTKSENVMSSTSQDTQNRSPQSKYECLIGVWKFSSYVRKDLQSNKTKDVFGQNPRGYLIYTREQRMMALVIPETRENLKSDADRIDHHKKMVSYSGTYTVSDNTVTHHVDVAWNEAWVGTHQQRFFQIDGSRLTITTVPTVYNIGEGEQISTLILNRCTDTTM